MATRHAQHTQGDVQSTGRKFPRQQGYYEPDEIGTGSQKRHEETHAICTTREGTEKAVNNNNKLVIEERTFYFCNSRNSWSVRRSVSLSVSVSGPVVKSVDQSLCLNEALSRKNSRVTSFLRNSTNFGTPDQ